MFRELFTEATDKVLVDVYYNKPGSTGSIKTGGQYEVLKLTKSKVKLKKVKGFDSFMSNQTMDDDSSVIPDTLDVKYRANWRYNVSPLDINIEHGLDNNSYTLMIDNNSIENFKEMIYKVKYK